MLFRMLPTMNRRHFQGQHENEEILRVIHRHWFNLFSHLFAVIFFSFLLISSLLVLPILFPDIVSAENWRFFVFVENTFFIFMWIFGFLVWIDYYFDVWIITSERIVNIEQRGLFVREISELNFARVQDVTAEVKGIIPTILNYGDVFIQTAGETERFVFRQVGDPYKIKDMIIQLSRNSSRQDLQNAVSAIKSQLS